MFPQDEIITKNPVDARELTDRELLLILHERVGTMGRDLHDLRNDHAVRIASLESKIEMIQIHKADKAVTDSALQKLIEEGVLRTGQINKLTNYIWFGWGVLAVLQILLALVLKYGLPH